MSRIEINPLFLQTVLIVLIILFGLFAMTFRPYERIYIDGVWQTLYSEDPLYPARRSLMVFGLFACILSLCLFVYDLVRNSLQGKDVILHLSIIILAWTLGWAAYPYWVNGMFQAYLGRAPWADFDPKPLIAGTWVMPGWRVGVLILLLLYLGTVPVLLLTALTDSIKQRDWKHGVRVVLYLGLAGAFFSLSPNYWIWLGD